MGHWELTQISKDDPDTIIICRHHSVADVDGSTMILSVNKQRTLASREIWIGDEAHPLEIQITTGTGQTAIIFLHQHRFSTHDRLVVHGHIEGARHQYEWKKSQLSEGGKKSSSKSSSIFGVWAKLRLHVTADGMVELRPQDPAMKFALVMLTEGAGGVAPLEFSLLQFRIPMFAKAKPPAYQAAGA